MLDVLLINSPLYNQKIESNERFLPPFGLGYIGNELRKKNLGTELLDCVLENLTVPEVISSIDRKQPRFVGINIFSVNFELVKNIIEGYSGDVTFLIGGRSAGVLCNQILDFETDNRIIVIIGEGDYIASDIVLGDLKERPSYVRNENRLAYTVDGESIYFPNDLSFLSPDRKLFRNRVLINSFGHKEATIITSRECLYDCAFCGAARSLNQDVPVRESSEKAIICELKAIATLDSDIEDIRVLDDLFLKNQSSVERAIRIFGSFSYKWRAMAHVISLKNVELSHLVALRKSGCEELEIGIESGDREMRRLINKKGSVGDVVETITKILKAGINVKGYFIYGFPNETFNQCQKTFNLAQKMAEVAKGTEAHFRASAFSFRPYHGTKLYDMIKESQQINFRHDNMLDGLTGRKQFNFSAGNFSACTEEELRNFVIRTNMLQ